MVWTTSTVGNAASTGDYAADSSPLQLWETAKDGIGGDQEAIILTDIVDDLSVDDWPVTGSNNLWIHGDINGEDKHTWRVPTGGSYPCIPRTAMVCDTFLVEDLIIDGNDAVPSRAAFYIQGGCNVTTFNRVRFTRTSGPAAYLLSSSSCVTGIFTNVIIDNAKTNGIIIQAQPSGIEVILNNCGIFQSSGIGIEGANNALITRRFYNSIFMNNGSADISTDASATTDVISCITSDGTGKTASHNDTSNTLINRSDTGTYFMGYAEENYKPAHSTPATWQITLHTNKIPATDFASVVRVANTIGPYEYIASTFTNMAKVK